MGLGWLGHAQTILDLTSLLELDMEKSAVKPRVRHNQTGMPTQTRDIPTNHFCLSINFMSNAAMKMSLSSGAIMKPILDKATINESEEIGRSPNTVITNEVANTAHSDPDYIRKNYDAVYDLVKECESEQVINYFNRFENIFPELHKKKWLPLDTTCCWVQMKHSNEWVHCQYFLMLDILLAYDLSTSEMGPGIMLASTFYAGLFSHLSSRSLWITKDGSKVTTVCPEKYCSIWAWGKYEDKNN